MKRKITDRLVATLKPGDIVRDHGEGAVVGFLARAYPSGVTYSVRSERVRHGRKLNAVLGPAKAAGGVLTASEAREQARIALARHLAVEPPPKEARPADEPTIANVWERHDAWLKAEGATARTREAYVYVRKNLSDAVLQTPLRDLSEDQTIMEREFDRVRQTKGREAAKQVGRYVSALYLHALKFIDTTLPARHPCVKISKRIRVAKSSQPLDVLSREQLPTWWRAAQTLEPLRTYFHKFALLSGLRRNDLVTMEWSHVDYDSMTMRVPSPKGGKAFDLILSAPMLNCLKVANEEGFRWMDKHRPGEPLRWIWPGGSRRSLDIDGNLKSEDGHITTLWKDKRVVGCSMHGYRRSYASIAADVGVSEEIIGKLLNHQSAGITSHYIKTTAIGRILRESQERISEAIIAAINAGTPEGDDGYPRWAEAQAAMPDPLADLIRR